MWSGFGQTELSWFGYSDVCSEEEEEEGGGSFFADDEGWSVVDLPRLHKLHEVNVTSVSHDQASDLPDLISAGERKY